MECHLKNYSMGKSEFYMSYVDIYSCCIRKSIYNIGNCICDMLTIINVTCKFMCDMRYLICSMFSFICKVSCSIYDISILLCSTSETIYLVSKKSICLLQFIHNMGKNSALRVNFCCIQFAMLYLQNHSFMLNIICGIGRFTF